MAGSGAVVERRSMCQEDALAEKVELGAAVQLTLDHLTVGVAFDRAGVRVLVRPLRTASKSLSR
jgi:hypothetical protein